MKHFAPVFSFHVLFGAVLLCASFLLNPAVAHAQDTSTTPSSATDGIRIAMLMGQVSLLSDPGQGGTNAFGIGAEASYKIEDRWALALRYLGSSHPAAEHRELSFGTEYAFSPYEDVAFPTLSAGAAFHSNDLKSINRKGDAVGLYLGAGVEFNLAPNLRLGPELRFTKAFASRAMNGAQEIDVVANSYTFLARLIYSL